nr:hypothetical protein [Sciscionella marina]
MMRLETQNRVRGETRGRSSPVARMPPGFRSGLICGRSNSRVLFAGIVQGLVDDSPCHSVVSPLRDGRVPIGLYPRQPLDPLSQFGPMVPGQGVDVLDFLIGGINRGNRDDHGCAHISFVTQHTDRPGRDDATGKSGFLGQHDGVQRPTGVRGSDDIAVFTGTSGVSLDYSLQTLFQAIMADLVSVAVTSRLFDYDVHHTLLAQHHPRGS